MQETNNSFGSNDEIDLARLFSALWKKRLIILLFALLGMFIGALLYLVSWLSQPTKVNISYNLMLTFEGVQEGRYPNGKSFSLNDIVATPVLANVYRNFELNEYGFSERDFFEAVSITPFATNRQFIESRFKELLSDKKLSNAEIAELDAQFARELKNASARFASLNVVYELSKALPDEFMLRVVEAIPNEWARLSIENYGVLDIGLAVPDELDLVQMERAEYVVNVDYLSDFQERLLKVASRLNQDEVGVLIADPETGLNAQNIQNELVFLQEYTIGPLQSAFLVSPIFKDEVNATYFLQNQLVLAEAKLDQLRRESGAIKDVISTYSELTKAQMNSGSRTGESSLAGAQFGDEFLSKLLSLGDELSNSKYKQSLLDRVLALNLEAETMSTRIVQTRRKLELVKQSEAGSEKIKNKVDYELAYTQEKLGDYRTSLNRILKIRNEKMLGSSGNLMEPISEPLYASNLRGQLKRLVKYVSIPTFFGSVFGLFVALMIAVRYQNKSAGN